MFDCYFLNCIFIPNSILCNQEEFAPKSEGDSGWRDIFN